MRVLIRKGFASWLLLVAALGLLSSCAHWRADFEEPRLNLTSIRALPGEGMAQSFAIGLRVTNPNAIPLKLVGLSYRLNLQGYDLLDGVANDIPEIAAFGDTDLELVATVNLLNSLRFVQSLLAKPQEPLVYVLSAKLGLDSRWLPTLRLEEKGEIRLGR